MSIKSLVKKLTPEFLLKAYHYGLALLGAVWYGFPSGKLIVIGVTGTSGKSTTVDFITRILEEPFDAAQGKHGDKVASLSSVRFKIGEKEWKNQLKMTMPGRFVIQKFLRQAVREKCRYAVLEVTSEGIKQFRHKFINFDTAVFTNLSPEHIESHGGFENYRKEKLKLFWAAKNIHTVNTDDENAKYFLDVPAHKKYFFEVQLEKSAPEKRMATDFNGKINWIKDKDAHITAENVAHNLSGIDFEISGMHFHLNIMGDFNVYNALAAISVAKAYNISLETCQKALEKVTGIPGRMELVSKNPLVVVDYAHTPEQLELAYKSLAPKSLVCVLGSCGGGRDKWKRPVLGKIAAQYCRDIIITNEDPYDEDPLEIMEQVAGGIGEHKHSIVLDRKEAIKKALEFTQPQDAVIITGKGSEIWMCLARGKKIPWSDKEAVIEAVSGAKA